MEVQTIQREQGLLIIIWGWGKDGEKNPGGGGSLKECSTREERRKNHKDN
jgi:hypothetical protein